MRSVSPIANVYRISVKSSVCMRVYASVSEVKCCNLATSGEPPTETETISKACKHLQRWQHCSDKHNAAQWDGNSCPRNLSHAEIYDGQRKNDTYFINIEEKFLEQAQSMSTSDPQLLIRSFSGRG